MLISRVRADVNLDTLAAALRDRNPERTRFDRFALVKATVGEGQERAFLVEANSKLDKDLDLLKTAGAGKVVALTTKDASGNDVRVTGKVVGYAEIGSAVAHRLQIIGSATGILTAGCLAFMNAVGGLPAHLNAGPWTALGLGAIALYGAATAFGRVITKSDGADWAGITADEARESPAVPVEIAGVAKEVPPVAALPAPVESPFYLTTQPREKQLA